MFTSFMALNVAEGPSKPGPASKLTARRFTKNDIRLFVFSIQVFRSGSTVQAFSNFRWKSKLNCMQFRQGILIGRELEIADHLMQRKTLQQISISTGLGRKVVKAHIRNMRLKLHASNIPRLRQLLKDIFADKATAGSSSPT